MGYQIRSPTKGRVRIVEFWWAWDTRISVLRNYISTPSDFALDHSAMRRLPV